MILKDSVAPEGSQTGPSNHNMTGLARMTRSFTSGTSAFWAIILTRKLDSTSPSPVLWWDEVNNVVNEVTPILSAPDLALSMELGAEVVRRSANALGAALALGETELEASDILLLDQKSAKLVEAIAKGCMTAIATIPPEEIVKITAEAADHLPGFSRDEAMTLWSDLGIEVASAMSYLQVWASLPAPAPGRHMARQMVMEYTFRAQEAVCLNWTEGRTLNRWTSRAQHLLNLIREAASS